TALPHHHVAEVGLDIRAHVVRDVVRGLAENRMSFQRTRKEPVREYLVEIAAARQLPDHGESAGVQTVQGALVSEATMVRSEGRAVVVEINDLAGRHRVRRSLGEYRIYRCLRGPVVGLLASIIAAR